MVAKVSETVLCQVCSHYSKKSYKRFKGYESSYNLSSKKRISKNERAVY